MTTSGEDQGMLCKKGVQKKTKQDRKRKNNALRNSLKNKPLVTKNRT